MDNYKGDVVEMIKNIIYKNDKKFIQLIIKCIECDNSYTGTSAFDRLNENILGAERMGWNVNDELCVNCKEQIFFEGLTNG